MSDASEPSRVASSPAADIPPRRFADREPVSLDEAQAALGEGRFTPEAVTRVGDALGPTGFPGAGTGSSGRLARGYVALHSHATGASTLAGPDVLRAQQVAEFRRVAGPSPASGSAERLLWTIADPTAALLAALIRGLIAEGRTSSLRNLLQAPPAASLGPPSLKPNDPLAVYLAWAYCVLGEHDRARGALGVLTGSWRQQSAVDLLEVLIEAGEALAASSSSDNDFLRLASRLERAAGPVEHDFPRLADDAHVARGKLLVGGARLLQAETAFRQALAPTPEARDLQPHLGALLGLAALEARLGRETRLAEAQELSLLAVREYPRCPEAHLLSAHIYARRLDRVGLARRLRRLARSHPNGAPSPLLERTAEAMASWLAGDARRAVKKMGQAMAQGEAAPGVDGVRGRPLGESDHGLALFMGYAARLALAARRPALMQKVLALADSAPAHARSADLPILTAAAELNAGDARAGRGRLEALLALDPENELATACLARQTPPADGGALPRMPDYLLQLPRSETAAPYPTLVERESADADAEGPTYAEPDEIAPLIARCLPDASLAGLPAASRRRR